MLVSQMLATCALQNKVCMPYLLHSRIDFQPPLHAQTTVSTNYRSSELLVDCLIFFITFAGPSYNCNCMRHISDIYNSAAQPDIICCMSSRQPSPEATVISKLIATTYTAFILMDRRSADNELQGNKYSLLLNPMIK